MSPTMGFMGFMGMGLPFGTQRGPRVGEALVSPYITYMGPTIGQPWALLGPNQWACSIKILFSQCVWKKWYYIGSFIGRPICASLNTNEWQNSGFAWVISWANQYEAHVIPICGETVVIHGQFHGPTMWSPCYVNVWKKSGLTWAVSWANQCEPQATPMWAPSNTVVLHGQLHGPTSVEPCNSNVWQDSVSRWAVSFSDQCKPHAMPICGKTVAFHVQFHGPTRVNPM